MGRSGHFPDPAAGEPGEKVISRVRTLVRLLPALLIVAGAVFDHVTPREFTAVPFFTAAPLIAAPLSSLRTTVVTGAAALLAEYTVRVRFGFVPDADTVTETVTVATVAVLAVVINRVVRRGDRRLASAREIAESVQRAVLPEPEARIGGFEIAARYEAAHEDALIGGDLYAVQDTAYGVRLVLGDVRGKGMGAVAAVAVVIGAFREAAEQEATLEAVAQRLERALAREGARRDGLDAVGGVHHRRPRRDSRTATGSYASSTAATPPPLLLAADGTLRTLDPAEPALPLGMGDLGTWPDRADEAAFPGGATLLLHTDGLSEARDEHGAFFDPADRLRGPGLPRPGHPARHPRRRGAPAHGRRDRGRHGAARRTRP